MWVGLKYYTDTVFSIAWRENKKLKSLLGFYPKNNSLGQEFHLVPCQPLNEMLCCLSQSKVCLICLFFKRDRVSVGAHELGRGVGGERERLLNKFHTQCRVLHGLRSHNPKSMTWAKIKSQTLTIWPTREPLHITTLQWSQPLSQDT